MQRQSQKPSKSSSITPEGIQILSKAAHPVLEKTRTISEAERADSVGRKLLKNFEKDAKRLFNQASLPINVDGLNEKERKQFDVADILSPAPKTDVLWCHGYIPALNKADQSENCKEFEKKCRSALGFINEHNANKLANSWRKQLLPYLHSLIKKMLLQQKSPAEHKGVEISTQIARFKQETQNMVKFITINKYPGPGIRNFEEISRDFKQWGIKFNMTPSPVLASHARLHVPAKKPATPIISATPGMRSAAIIIKKV